MRRRLKAVHGHPKPSVVIPVHADAPARRETPGTHEDHRSDA